MSDRFGFLFLGVALFILGMYAISRPDAVKKELADGPYFMTGLGSLPVWVFRGLGVVTLGMAGFFFHMFWTH